MDRLETESLTCKISGQANVYIRHGNAARQTVEISGQGHYEATDFSVQDSQITISGQGMAWIRSKESLDMTISEMGSCSYLGNPRIKQRVSGLGQAARSIRN